MRVGVAPRACSCLRVCWPNPVAEQTESKLAVGHAATSTSLREMSFTLFVTTLTDLTYAFGVELCGRFRIVGTRTDP